MGRLKSVFVASGTLVPKRICRVYRLESARAVTVKGVSRSMEREPLSQARTYGEC